MTRQALASKIAKYEGLKSQVSIGDIREILKILVKFELDSTDEAVADSGDITGWLADEKAKRKKK